MRAVQSSIRSLSRRWMGLSGRPLCHKGTPGNARFPFVDLPPHPSHPRADVDLRALRRRARRAGRGFRPGGALEQMDQLLRNEAATRGVDVAITLGGLAMGEEALRQHEVK